MVIAINQWSFRGILFYKNASFGLVIHVYTYIYIMIPEEKDTLLGTITYPPYQNTALFESMIFRSFSHRFGVGYVILPFPGNGYSSRQLIRSLRQAFGFGYEFDLCPRDGGSFRKKRFGREAFFSLMVFLMT